VKRVWPDASWPESWTYSYPYDLEEIYGVNSHLGYAYAYDRRRALILRLIEEVVAADGRILDIGAAQGNFTLALAESGYAVTWNDLRSDLAGYVRLKQETGSVDYAPGNVFELTFDEEFDCVLIAEVVEHVAHPDCFLRKAAELVRPGGWVVMTTPNGAYFNNRLPRFSDCQDPSALETRQFGPNADDHIFLLWPDEIRELGAAAGLILERQIWFNTPLTCGYLKMEPMLRALPRSWVMALEKTAGRLPPAIQQRLMVQTGALYRKPKAGLCGEPGTPAEGLSA
jgi:2-polyprenyl-6-hydroxyphenyl methylase/3-demethylubiquinone-9 3-methyltransferase